LVKFRNNSNQTIVVLGAAGFLGRYVVSLLVNRGYIVRAGVRNPDKARHLLVMGRLRQVIIYPCNIIDSNDVNDIVNGADIVINLVGILSENKKQNFINVHLNGAINIANACNQNKIKSLTHVSALAIDKSSKSIYAKTKLEAEKNIKSIFNNTIIIRPSVIFGPEDNFTNKFAKMALISPFMPLINKGLTKFQPVSVLDVAKAIEIVILDKIHIGNIYNLGGPEIFTFKEIISLILESIEKEKLYINISFPLAKIMAILTNFLPNAPITLDQVILLKNDNIVTSKSKGFSELGIKPSSMKVMIKKYLSRYKVSY
tara:strand:- start:6197 stop:7141 length:945 start_codon:yes stop_codon:yes gene_type:complete